MKFNLYVIEKDWKRFPTFQGKYGFLAYFINMNHQKIEKKKTQFEYFEIFNIIMHILETCININ